MSIPKFNKFIKFEDLILYEDDDILLINKPLYMASLDDKSRKNVYHLSKKYNSDLTPCHRLDKMTSGVLIMAKGLDNYRHISLQFQHRKIKKRYHTVVGGVHNFEGHKIDLPLLISTNKKVSVNKQEGKKSTTVVYTEKQFRNFTLLRCEPVTGRMHQIRVHLAAIKCPIVGDKLYGGEDIFLSKIKRKYHPSGRKEEMPINHEYLLHAHSLTFQHPTEEEEMTITAPYTKNFETVLKVLSKYNAQ